MSAFGVRIAGVGHYAPEKILTNADFEKMLETSDEWITTRTGMKERHIAADGEFASDMATAAARNALAQAGLTPADLDLIIVATVTPDYPFPATACIVGNNLGITGVAGFDIEIACSGFLYGMTIASSMIRSGAMKRILLVGVERLSTFVDYEDRGTAVLFGDGAGAAVFERSATDSFLACELGADGSNPAALWMPGGGTREPLNAERLAAKRDRIKMEGKEVFRFAVTKMAEASRIAIERAGIAPADVDLLIPHQANKRIVDAVAKSLEIPGERVVLNIHKYGNTSAASIGIALSEAVAEGRLHDGDLVVFAAFGGGLSWGAVAWRWAA